MRSARGRVLGWAVVAAYAAALAAVSVHAIAEDDLDRGGVAGRAEATTDPEAAAGLVAAWERSRRATFVTVGTYERHSEVTGATITSEDVVAQRPPRRVHRQLGGVDGRDDDRLLLCPAPPAGSDEAEPCRFGPSTGVTYERSVEREVAGLRSLTGGTAPLYAVTSARPGCFALDLLRVDPRAPFGIAASFCFDAETGAPVARRVEHEGGIVEVLTVTSVRASVSDADLEP
jgi:hypothetical protein